MHTSMMRNKSAYKDATKVISLFGLRPEHVGLKAPGLKPQMSQQA